MYTKEKINDLFEKVVSALDISETLFDRAEKEYKDLGTWIDGETPDYKIDIYPQGSFALGTVVRPISDEDEYDIDLVCEFSESYGLSAKQLKVDEVKPLLERYKGNVTDLEEKSRCWRVEYDHFKGFHMDVIPSCNYGNHILITDKVEGGYQYIGSNPRGYMAWFTGQMKVSREKLIEHYIKQHQGTVFSQATIAPIKEYKIKTPLQKAVQLLKRHRDIAFAEDETNSAPISIIITTIAGYLYDNQDNIFDTIDNFLSSAKAFVYDNMRDGQYYIENPSYAGENFADKWNEHPERAEAFFEWIDMAKANLIEALLKVEHKIEMGSSLKTSLGEKTVTRVFNRIAEEEIALIKNKDAKIDTTTGAISSAGTVTIPRNHHYGK